MKKIIGIIFVSLMFCNIGFAEIRLIEKERITEHRISTWCVDGYKFVVVDRKHTEASSLVQFFERRSGKSLPAKC